MQAIPSSIRAAGALVCAQAALGLAFAAALLVRAANGAERLGEVVAEAGYFTVLGAGVLLVGLGLVRGRQWARTPAIVLQLLLLGVAWYAAVPSGRPEFGVPVAIVCIAVAVLLFRSKDLAS